MKGYKIFANNCLSIFCLPSLVLGPAVLRVREKKEEEVKSMSL